ncbi:MAG: tetratricopeptide repeat protein, partial [Acidobacteriota bacterium]
ACMKSSLVVAVGVGAAGLCLWLPTETAAQSAAKLSKRQRTTLEAVVAAVDAAAASSVAATPAEWRSHVLRASNGAHYVALSATVPTAAAPASAVVLYVRLAMRYPSGSQPVAAERSAVMEWLRGLRSEPLPMRASRSMTVPQGEMPVGGAASLAGRGNADAMDASNVLRLQEKERERVARDRADREKHRREALESAATAPALAMHPFEDFDVQARLAPAGPGVVVERGLTAGPGDYDIYLAWAEPSSGNQPPVVRVVTERLSLPGASATDFSLSDIVLADAVRALPAPYPVDQQGAHPYAIAALEAVPARDHVFRVDEALSVLFQVINPSGSATGMPDVDVAFRVTRLVDDTREELVGSLPVQHFNRTNLPSDFDVAKGHPVFAAVQAPLRTFARGHYRLAITATDNIGARQAAGDVRFDVTGTPESLLREAPTPGRAYRREAVLTSSTLAALARALAPPAPSPELRQALEHVSAGRFADLVQTNLTDPAERPTALALRGLALYGLGDSARTVAAQLQQAAEQGAPAAPVQLLIGATAALGGDDRAAIAAWNQAREGGIDDASVATLLVDAYLRQGDVARAAAMGQAALDSEPGNTAAIRGLAVTLIAATRYAEALALLDARPRAAEPDPDSEFLVLHALYAGLVSGRPAGGDVAARERFAAGARAYAEHGGRNVDLVRAWVEVLPDTVKR